MDRLWNYEEYVTLLSHDNSLVREWAFDALKKKYPNRYTDEVSRLISDEDSHLAYGAPNDIILKPVKEGKGIDLFLVEYLVDYWHARDYFFDLTKGQEGKSIINDSAEAIDFFFNMNDHLSIGQEAKDKIKSLIVKKKYHDLITTLMFEARNIKQKRYPEKTVPGDIQELFNKDSAGVFLFEELSRQPSLWHTIKASKNTCDTEFLVSLVLSVYFSIIERNAYVKALLPDAEVSDLIRSIQNAGSGLPEKIFQKTVNLAPVDELKSSLSEDLNTWGDIKIVKIMGQIGKKEFVPDLIHVLNNAKKRLPAHSTKPLKLCAFFNICVIFW
ncbi:MAG: hypothetical protein R6U68_08710 [Desulfobacteraceae bacterium]